METLIDVLDGAMVTIAMYTINIGHPGMLLGSFRNTQVDGNGRAWRYNSLGQLDSIMGPMAYKNDIGTPWFYGQYLLFACIWLAPGFWSKNFSDASLAVAAGSFLA